MMRTDGRVGHSGAWYEATVQATHNVTEPPRSRQATVDDPVLPRFAAALRACYGLRLERAVLFGSRARGDFRQDSDHDVAVFLRDNRGLWTELHPLAEITTDILTDTGEVISAKPFPAGSYRERSAFMGEIRRDGIDL